MSYNSNSQFSTQENLPFCKLKGIVDKEEAGMAMRSISYSIDHIYVTINNPFPMLSKCNIHMYPSPQA